MVFSTTEVVVRDVAEGAEAILFTNLGGVPVLRRAMKTVIGGLSRRRIFPKGAAIVYIGDPANELFIVARGSVSVNITLASGSQRRSGTVLADSEVECDMLKVDDFNRLVDSHPRIRITILENISLALCSRLRKANRELSVFDRCDAALR